jgi:hypothetical protein
MVAIDDCFVGMTVVHHLTMLVRAGVKQSVTSQAAQRLFPREQLTRWRSVATMETAAISGQTEELCRCDSSHLQNPVVCGLDVERIA